MEVDEQNGFKEAVSTHTTEGQKHKTDDTHKTESDTINTGQGLYDMDTTSIGKDENGTDTNSTEKARVSL